MPPGWTGWAIFSIQSGAAQAVETGLNITTISGVNEADVSISATVTLGSTNTHAGLIARYSGAGDGNMYLGALVNIGGANSAQIWRSVNGVWSLLATRTGQQLVRHPGARGCR